MRPDVKLILSKATLDAIRLKEVKFEDAVAKGDFRFEGRREAFSEFMALLDVFPMWFNTVMP